MSLPRTWKEQEDYEKSIILEKFWDQRIVHPQNDLQKENSINAIKNQFLLALPPPAMKHQEWREKVNKAWADKSAFASKEAFFEFFKHISSVKAVACAEGLMEFPKLIEEPARITEDERKAFQQYTKDKKLTVSAAFGSVKTQILSGCSTDYKTTDIFTTQSITKVFTGVLAIKLLQEKILTEEDLDKPPIKLKQSAKDLLRNHDKIEARLGETTLHQAMTHHAGLGVGGAGFGDYYSNYIDAIEKARATGQPIPEVKSAEDFLQFIPNETSSFGKEHWKYSNSGIVLSALSLEHLYNEHRINHPEKKLEVLDFDGMLKKYVTDPAEMQYFTPSSHGLAVKFNPEDLNAEHMRGSPGGGYFSTVNDLQKFAGWLYKQCQDPAFVKLIEKYGQEFCPFPQSKTIEHTGDGPSNSGFFSFNWETGNVVIVLNDQRAIAASEVGREAKNHFLTQKSPAKEKELPNELKASSGSTPNTKPRVRTTSASDVRSGQQHSFFKRSQSEPDLHHLTKHITKPKP